MYKISLIIPCYNCQETIDSLVQSLLLLNSEDVELVFINDGSVDRTFEILSKYDNISNILLIDSSNRGVSFARNLGLEAATGNWISFIDSDDNINLSVLNHFLEESSGIKSDIVRFSLKINYPSNSRKVLFSNNYIHYTNSQFDYIYRLLFGCTNYGNRRIDEFGITGGVIYRRSFLFKYNIRFNPNISYLEDLLFLIESVINASSLDISNEILYIKNETTNSTTGRFDLDDVESVLKATELINIMVSFQIEHIYKYFLRFKIGVLELIYSQPIKSGVFEANQLIFVYKSNKRISAFIHSLKLIECLRSPYLNVKDYIKLFIIMSKSSLLLNLFKVL